MNRPILAAIAVIVTGVLAPALPACATSSPGASTPATFTLTAPPLTIGSTCYARSGAGIWTARETILWSGRTETISEA